MAELSASILRVAERREMRDVVAHGRGSKQPVVVIVSSWRHRGSAQLLRHRSSSAILALLFAE